MTELKCQNCGSTDIVFKEKGKFKCDSCGVVYKEEQLESMRVQIEGKVEVEGIHTANQLLKNAKTFEEMGKYDKAFEVYKKVTDDYPEIEEGWFGLKRSKKVNEFLLIKAGSYRREVAGSGVFKNKEVEVEMTYDFFIDKKTISFEEYFEFCKDLGKTLPERYIKKILGIKQKPNGWSSVPNIPRYHALEYCNYLNEKLKLAKPYDQNGNMIDSNGKKTNNPMHIEGFRLPTEAEWHYAAVGGHKFYNNDKNYKYDRTNILGLDMSGSWQWCFDVFSQNFFQNAPLKNPINTENHEILETNFVIRGGCFYKGSYQSFFCTEDRKKSASLYEIQSDEPYNFLGIRLVKTA